MAGRGHEPRNAGGPLGAGKGRKSSLRWSLQGIQPCGRLDFRLLTAGTRRLNLCRLKLLCLVQQPWEVNALSTEKKK